MGRGPSWAAVGGGVAGAAVGCSLAAVVAIAAGPTALFVPRQPPDAWLRVLSFNVRYDNPADGPNAWPHRAERVAGLIRFHAPDVAGLQEALVHQVNELAERLDGYGWVGVGRDDGAEEGEFSPIFYRVERLRLVEHGTWWLSETPHVPGSRGWDAALPRIATWAVFEDREGGPELLVVNAHFDHRGEAARRESARLVRAKLAERAEGRPAILTGDLNAEPGSAPLRVLTGCGPSSRCLRDARVVAARRYGPEGTYYGFAVTGDTGPRIDYVLGTVDLQVVRHAHLTDSEAGFYPSDHLPVLADFTSGRPRGPESARTGPPSPAVRPGGGRGR